MTQELLPLLRYHARLGLSWPALAAPLGCAAAVALLTATTPAPERGHDLAVVLETGLPLLAALLAAPLVAAERERNTLGLIAARLSLLHFLAARLSLLIAFLLACCGLTLVAARLLWGGPLGWEALPRAGAPALALAALALLAASWGRSTVHGYIPSIAFWMGALMVAPLLPRQDLWLTLNPFAWTFGASAAVVLQSKLLYTALGVLLLLPQWPLLRWPERLIRQT